MTDDPRRIPELDPTPTMEENPGELCHWLWDAEIRASHRVDSFRAGMEYAAELANIVDMTKPGRAGQYIYDRIKAHDEWAKERKQRGTCVWTQQVQGFWITCNNIEPHRGAFCPNCGKPISVATSETKEEKC